MTEKTVAILFPHQLFEKLPFQAREIYLVEEWLFFNQYRFHQAKLAFHRASMKAYFDDLTSKGVTVTYIDAQSPLNDIRQLIGTLGRDGVNKIEIIEVCDNWLEKRIKESAARCEIEIKTHVSELFLNSQEEIHSYFGNKNRFYQTDFYIRERKKRKILVDQMDQPEGGKWSYDVDNRKKYPRGKVPPSTLFLGSNSYYSEACDYIRQNYSQNPGEIDSKKRYPITHREAREWLNTFLKERFLYFGLYEDAIMRNESVLHHSVLTPMLNVGLLTPQMIIDEVIQYSKKTTIPLNSLEGFIRQIIGWREFIRAVYVEKGTFQRNRNFWNFTHEIPDAFYTATTGIEPIDQTILKILKTGYCHHIERLMILSNFMMLCEIHPHAVYRWFMEMFIDAYDWVMVPNVYGMGQFADGGLMCTKPYISGSNYIFKMSDYPLKNDWAPVWDGLFWNFMDKHRAFFLKNPRLSMLVSSFDKMPIEKRTLLLQNAANFLQKIHHHHATTRSETISSH